jgi:hypothetical protein
MRTAPSAFTRRLQKEFGGRLRIRWSSERGEWHVEQRVSRAHLPQHRINDNDDAGIRQRDGYDYLLAIREGDRMPCPRCGGTTRVPVMATGEARCPSCDTRYAAAYFPLEGDALIQYLRRLDPTLGWHREIVKNIEAANAAVPRRQQRALDNALETGVKDRWKDIAEIPHVGYTGREKAWDR